MFCIVSYILEKYVYDLKIRSCLRDGVHIISLLISSFTVPSPTPFVILTLIVESTEIIPTDIVKSINKVSLVKFCEIMRDVASDDFKKIPSGIIEGILSCTEYTDERTVFT